MATIGQHKNNLFKKAQNLGNEYSDNFYKRSLSRQLMQRKMDLICLVDNEIIETNKKLNQLRLELSNINKSKNKINKKFVVEKSIQVSEPRDVSIQVDECENIRKSNEYSDDTSNELITQNLQTIQLNDSSSKKEKTKDSDQCQILTDLLLSMKDLIEKQKNLSDGNNKVVSSIGKCDAISREQIYLEKIDKITKQQSLNKNKSNNKQETETIEVLLNQEKVVDSIASKIYNMLQDKLEIKPNQDKEVDTNTKKIYRSVAIETSLNNDEDIDAPTVHFLDETEYLDLPERLELIRKKDTNNYLENSIVDDNYFLNNTSKLTDDIRINQEFNPLQVNFVNRNLTLKSVDEDFSLPDASSCNSSMFHTLNDITSNKSTPKKSLRVSFSTKAPSLCSTPKSLYKSAINEDTQTTFEISNPDVTLNTVNGTALSSLTSVNLSNLDRDLFWKEVFANSELNYKL